MSGHTLGTARTILHKDNFAQSSQDFVFCRTKGVIACYSTFFKEHKAQSCGLCPHSSQSIAHFKKANGPILDKGFRLSQERRSLVKRATNENI